jgi:hypothetical protein
MFFNAGFIGCPAFDGVFYMNTNIQEFTADGTWTKPPGAKFVFVEVIGGGGGGAGGGVSAGAAAFAGGNGGRRVPGEYDTITGGTAGNPGTTPANNVPPTLVGSGGAGGGSQVGGGNGGAGGNGSSYGGAGGGGGSANSTGTGGDGGDGAPGFCRVTTFF